MFGGKSREIVCFSEKSFGKLRVRNWVKSLLPLVD